LKGSNFVVKMIISLAFILACVVFFYTYIKTPYPVEQKNTNNSQLDKWSLENSALNGAPLVENKNIYDFSKNEEMTKIYITVFPTSDTSGKLRKFSEYNLLTRKDKPDIFSLDANVEFGDANGDLNEVKNPDVINAAFSIRGSSTLNSAFKSYKIKLKNGTDTFYGQKTLNLNKHAFDISKISNKFSMDMMSTVPNISSLRTNFILVYIRDASLPQSAQSYKYYGLFTNVENPNKSSLNIRGFDGNGNMYKAINFLFQLNPDLKNVNDPTYNKASFEKVLQVKTGTDHSKLLNMLKDINDMNKDFNTSFKKYFNEENYLTWIACNILLGNEDTINQNFIIYSPTNSLTWYLMPWDYDGTFHFGKYQSHYSAPLSLKGVQRITGLTLHKRYFKQPGNLLKLTNKIKELLANNFTKDKVSALLNSYRPVLAATIPKTPDLIISSLRPNEFNAYLNQFYNQILVNYNKFLKSNNFPSPVFVAEPVRHKNGNVDLSWEPSFDYQGDLVHYSVTFAKDSSMKNVVFSAKNLTQQQYTYKKKIPKGTYYLKVSIIDSSGKVQCSRDVYEDVSKVYGVLPHFGVSQVVFR